MTDPTIPGPSGGVNNPPLGFDQFVTTNEARLRRALVASYGAEVGREAAADAMVHAWEQWHRVAEMANPVGYLYRVGRGKARRHRRMGRETGFAELPETGVTDAYPDLALRDALESLSPRQRAVVMLVDAWAYPQTEAASILGISQSALRRHRERAHRRLRTQVTALAGTGEPQTNSDQETDQ